MASGVAKLSSTLQRTESIDEFGQALLDGTVPLIGVAAAAFYAFDAELGRLRRAILTGRKRQTIKPGTVLT